MADGDLMPMDCGGLMFPAPPGQTVDVLQTRWQLALGERALSACREHHDHPLMAALEKALAGLSPLALARTFHHPLANEDLGTEPVASASPLPQRVLRHLPGAPDIGALAVVLTAGQIGDGLYLPHLHLTLLPTGGEVLGLVQQGRRLQLVRGDGLALTLNADQSPAAHIHHPLVRPEPRAGHLAVLNQLPEIRQGWSHLEPATGPEIGEAIDRLEQGLALFRRLWPQASSTLQRHIRSVVLLRNRGYQRSHTPTELCGTLFTTVGSPVMVGDLLAHESSHVRMHWFQACDPMIRARHHDDEEACFASPWRNDARPLNGLTLGVHAFLNVCEWYRRVIATVPEQAPRAPQILAKQLGKIRRAMVTLHREGQPTALGQTLLKEFAREEQRLQGHSQRVEPPVGASL